MKCRTKTIHNSIETYWLHYNIIDNYGYNIISMPSCVCIYYCMHKHIKFYLPCLYLNKLELPNVDQCKYLRYLF